MGLFSEFSILFPYLKSVRKLKTYLTFDIEFPETWKLPKKFVDEKRIVENDRDSVGFRLFSFIADFNEESVESTTNSIKNVIAYNKEREEKEKLFHSKVDELKNLFEKQNLNNLQALKFELKGKIELDDDEETSEPNRRDAGVVEE
jgi:hypothetical protein